LAIDGSVLGSRFVSMSELHFLLLDGGNDENRQHCGAYNLKKKESAPSN
jgi:hypothetical protein